VYIAGPIMNILLAWIVLAGVLSQGADVPLFESSAPVIGTVTEDSPASRAGLRVGDRILTVDGRSVDTWEDLSIEVLPRAGRELTVLVARDGGQVSVRITPDAVGRYEFGDIGIGPALRPQVTQVNAGTPAERAGFQARDVFVEVGGARGLTQEQVIERIRSSSDTPLAIVVERGGAEVPLTVTPTGGDGAATIGVGLTPWETPRIDPTMLEAFRLSAVQNWESTKLIGRTLRGLFTADTPVRQLMGPVAIAEMSGTAASIGWVALFNLMAMISLNLGLLNLMPVPVLDGGHIAILAVEGLARRDLSIKVKERILTVGAVAIVLLMVTVIFNDISRLLR
jgi:regulator of sigma E protease